MWFLFLTFISWTYPIFSFLYYSPFVYFSLISFWFVILLASIIIFVYPFLLNIFFVSHYLLILSIGVIVGCSYIFKLLFSIVNFISTVASSISLFLLWWFGALCLKYIGSVFGYWTIFLAQVWETSHQPSLSLVTPAHCKCLSWKGTGN